MVISKHIHSCLLVKENGVDILIDPGSFTYEEKGLTIDQIDKLDYILITHEHPDHMYVPFIKEIVQKFPSVKIITNPSAVEILKKEGIEASSESTADIVISEMPHEKVFDVTVPPNVQFAIFNKLTHPGDSHHFNLSTPFVALPVQAPWGSLNEAVTYAMSLKPKVIIPIHDWHWKEEARESFYQRLEKYFGENGIDFKPLKTGEQTTL